MAQHNLSKIVDDNGEEYLIKAKGLESQVQIALTGDVTGSVTTDLTSDPSISTSIGNGKVTESKLATDAVTNAKIKDGEITKAKFNASVYNETDGTIADGTNANLATKTQVKAYVESVINSEGHYKGVQSVATINTWTASNLHNGDRVITSSDPEGSGTGTLTLGNLPVVDGQEVIFFVSDDQSTKIWQTSEGNYKLKQAAKSDPDVPSSGTTESLSFIDTIVQNPNGEITATKKNMRSATTEHSGAVQLAGSIGATVSTENNKAASEKAVRDAINALDAEVPSTNGTNVQVKVTQTDGKISGVSITTDNTENKNNKITSWGTPTDTQYPSAKLVKDELDTKQGTVTGTAGNFAGFDSNGNLADSGSKPSDFATSAQGGKADSAIQGVKVNGTALTPDSNNVVDITAVTGVKGNSESTYRTGQVNITKGNIGLGNVDNTADASKEVLSATKLKTARNIDGVSFDGTANIHHYGECSTAAGTAAKTVTLSDSMTFTLAKGASVFIKFTNSNTASNPTLAVNGTTAVAIKRYGTTAPGTTAKTSWQAGSIVHLVYDGATTPSWQMVGWLNDDTQYSNLTLGQGYGTCSTAEATAAKVVTLSNYALTNFGIVAVKFTYGLCASATMNINSKGAKSIFIDGAAVTATTAKRVLAGDIAYFIYDGTQYQFLGTDKAERKFDINYRASDNALVFTKKFGTAS